jgi:hypothetical protein
MKTKKNTPYKRSIESTIATPRATDLQRKMTFESKDKILSNTCAVPKKQDKDSIKFVYNKNHMIKPPTSI